MVPALLLALGLVAGSFAVNGPLGVQAQARTSNAPVIRITRTSGTAGSMAGARLTTSTTVVKAGATLVVTGYNFMAGETVALSINGGADQLAMVHASAFGAVFARLTLPTTLTSGLHLLTATGLSSHVTAFIIVGVSGGAAPAQGASTEETQSYAAIMATSTTVARGKAITLRLRNFAAAETIALSFDNAATPLMVIHASSTGTAFVRLTIAATESRGLHTITAVGASHVALTAINVI
jgi:hypothetical protein